MLGNIWPAYDGLDGVGGMATGDERGCCDGGEVAAGPGGGFGALDDDGVAGEESCDYGGYEVVEL